nr:hypothetical protein [Tanacetum cinerariifolium]
MFTPAYVDSETITQANRTQNSRVPVPLLNDPYVAVRHAQLVDTDTESEPKEAPLEAKELQSLGSKVPFMVHAQPAMSPGLSASLTEAMALSNLAFWGELGDEDTNEDGEDKSSNTDDQRERLDDKGHGLDNKDHGLEEEGLGLKVEDEAVPKGQQAVSAMDTAVDEPL